MGWLTTLLVLVAVLQIVICDVDVRNAPWYKARSKPTGAKPKWSKWRTSACTVSCGRGIAFRYRTCAGGSIGEPGCRGPFKLPILCQQPVCVGGRPQPKHKSTRLPTKKPARQPIKPVVAALPVAVPITVPAVVPAAMHAKSVGEDVFILTAARSARAMPAKWGEWRMTGCSRSCGRGMSTKYRYCMGGKVGDPGCEGKQREGVECNKGVCPGANNKPSRPTRPTRPSRPTPPRVKAKWSNWGRSACSVTCGVGVERQTRTCVGGRVGEGECRGPTSQDVSCRYSACPKRIPITAPYRPPRWSPWKKSDGCSVTCGEGLTYQYRTCVGGFAGLPGCEGADKSHIKCKLPACPPKKRPTQDNRTRPTSNRRGSTSNVDRDPLARKVVDPLSVGPSRIRAKWGDWKRVDCSVTCGKGLTYQYRSCIGGKVGQRGCEGAAYSAQVPCTLLPCANDVPAIKSKPAIPKSQPKSTIVKQPPITRNRNNRVRVQASANIGEGPKTTTPSAKCKAKVDLGFILDSSGSLRRDYGREKRFLKSLAAAYGMGPDASRAGVVTFSYYTKHSIKMKDHDNIRSFNSAVDKIPLMGSTTRIDRALLMAKKELFAVENGGRPDVTKVLFLLTDGSQTPGPDVVDPGKVAEDLRKSLGVRIIVIGIGQGVNKTELLHLAGGHKSNLFTARSFDELVTDDFVHSITDKGCKNVAPPPKPAPPPKQAPPPKPVSAKGPTCTAKVDVGFILDSSGSLRADYQNEKNFLKELAGAFDISGQGSRAGVITFSYYTKHSIKLKDHDNIKDFNGAVDKIPLMGSTTRIDKALRMAQKELFQSQNGGRDGVPKLLILLTDGTQTKGSGAEDPGDISIELRKQGIRMIVVGIGKGVDKHELLHLAGNQESNMFMASSFSVLRDGDFIENIKKTSCLIPAKPTPPPPPACSQIVDAGFILDSSGSLRAEYGKEKKFLKALAGGFGISPDRSRAGVITFSYDSEHSIKMSEHTNQDSFNRAVDAIPLMGSTTRIDKALRQADAELFIEANGGRPAVPDILILLTDGTQTEDADAMDPALIAPHIRAKGIVLIVIGIGKGINQTELNNIGGNIPDNVYSAQNFDQLIKSDFIDKITKRACAVSKTATSTQSKLPPLKFIPMKRRGPTVPPSKRRLKDSVDASTARWNKWQKSECSVTCGRGMSARYRTCFNGKPGDGLCRGPERIQIPCYMSPCGLSPKRPPPGPVARPTPSARWGAWTKSSGCSVTCGVGVVTQFRRCEGGRPGDQGCEGKDREQVGCTMAACPPAAKWGDWVKSGCSVTCGLGVVTSYRRCEGGNPGDPGCEGKDRDQAGCRTPACPPAAKWGDWNKSGCSVTCGDGQATHYRACVGGRVGEGGCQGVEKEVVKCSKQPCVQAKWGNWMESGCSTTCGEGQATKYRHCKDGKVGDVGCEGEERQAVTCNRGPCPTAAPTAPPKPPARWSEWRDGGCSVTCGKGTIIRSRTCIGGNPGEAGCGGCDRRREVCQLAACSQQTSEPSRRQSVPVQPRAPVLPTFMGDRQPTPDRRPTAPRVPKPVASYPAAATAPQATWGEWFDQGCSVTCGRGTAYRYRACVGGAAGERGCEGNDRMHIDCSMRPCPSLGEYGIDFVRPTRTVLEERKPPNARPSIRSPSRQSPSRRYPLRTNNRAEWTTWMRGRCSVTCGKGVTVRRRSCKGGAAGQTGCEGPKETRAVCVMAACPTPAQQRRPTPAKRKPTTNRPTAPVSNAAGGKASVEGTWSEWKVSECSVTCDEGMATRYRTCVGGKLGLGGCTGLDRYSFICKRHPCSYYQNQGTNGTPPK